jgi:hypothetical protein
LVTAASLLV